MADNSSLNRFMDLSADGVEVDRSKKLRVGIVGTGWIAETHMKQYMQMDDVEIVAAAELVDGKAEKFFENLGVCGVHCYKSDVEMYEKENLDAVSICTYNKTHAECAINALNAGVNVLLEKPMCVTTEEAVEIMRAEKKSGKILSIGFQPRFDDDMKLLKEVVQSGVLGKIYYIQTGGEEEQVSLSHSVQHSLMKTQVLSALWVI